METKYKKLLSSKAISPREHILDILEDMGITQTELAHRMGRDKTKVNSIINGRLAITNETAIQLENVLGLSAEFFLNLQRSYELNLAYIKELERIENQEIQNLGKIDLKNLKMFGIIDNYMDKRILVKELLGFLGIDSLRLIPQVFPAIYRTSPKSNFHPEIVAVWLKWCQNNSTDIDLPDFSKKDLRKSIYRLRELTNQSLDNQLLNIKQILNNCGVGFVVTPALKNCQVNGASYIQNGNPIIAINDRNKKSDIFWFTLFHEIAHVLKHLNKKKSVIIDTDFSTGHIETEADEYANEILIPEKLYNQLVDEIKNKGNNIEIVRKYASLCGVNTGIIVGRLQYDSLIRNNALNQLKSKFVIKEIFT